MAYHISHPQLNPFKYRIFSLTPRDEANVMSRRFSAWHYGIKQEIVNDYFYILWPKVQVPYFLVDAIRFT